MSCCYKLQTHLIYLARDSIVTVSPSSGPLLPSTQALPWFLNLQEKHNENFIFLESSTYSSHSEIPEVLEKGWEIRSFEIIPINLHYFELINSALYALLPILHSFASGSISVATMDRLSNEILSLIFNYLPQQQKLQCMLVSRLWARVLYSGPMLETVVISNGFMFDDPDQRLDSLIKNIQTNTTSGKKCKRLVLDGQFKSELDKVTLATLMPNLDFLFLSSCSSKALTNQIPPKFAYTKMQSDQLQNWRDNLKTIIELHYSTDIFALLKTGVFSHLTTLVLGPNYRFLFKRFPEISKILENTPALETLSVQQVYISVFDLEEIHKNTTHLVALVLIDCVWTLSDKIPTCIRPATTMRTLQMLDFSTSLGLPLYIAHYIIIKYINLNSISFTVNRNVDTPQMTTSNQLISSFAHIINGIGYNLTTFRYNASANISDALSILDQHNTVLKNLQVNIIGNEAIAKEIMLLDSYHSLNTLSLNQVPLIRLEQFRNFTNLKSLKIEFIESDKKLTIDLNISLAELPKSLEIVKLSNVDLSFSRKNRWYNSSIKKLQLVGVKATKNLPKYLSAHMPKLESLSLRDCEIATQFELPEHHLTFVEIVMPEKFTRWDGGWNMYALERVFSYVTHLKTTIGNTTRQYRHQKNIFSEKHPLFSEDICDIHDLSIRNTCKPTHFDENLRHIHFRCASVQTFYYNGYLIL
ncbi:hypothetical protein K501DRAFT_271606 [Backusella circina FSU 941]|nr:hypothetical protein K501DRAFT_271606 [Backusella circina FSU 941]